MNWKEFLKPEGRKITIFIILLILNFLVWLLVQPGGLAMRMSDRFFCTIQENKTGIPVDICMNELKLKQQSREIFGITVMILTLVLNYLLSCFIVWIYDKRKKK